MTQKIGPREQQLRDMRAARTKPAVPPTIQRGTSGLSSLGARPKKRKKAKKRERS